MFSEGWQWAIEQMVNFGANPDHGSRYGWTVCFLPMFYLVHTIDRFDSEG